MIGELELCDRCADAYAGPDPAYAAGDCRIYRWDLADCIILAAAATRTPRDWVTDLCAGWQADARAVLPLVLATRLDKPLVLTGHSKGGPDIIDLADLLLQHGVAVAQLTTFEAAIAGDRGGRLRQVPGRDWAHHGDVVPLLPPGWARPRPVTWLSAPALPEYPDPFSNHHLATAIRPALLAMGIT